ncbi:MAG TPA: DUF349 domain-containing protein, partial [Gracilimonas sp.]|nr:DUF349 domain-containing protein [Gracilimonas sp.]
MENLEQDNLDSEKNEENKAEDLDQVSKTENEKAETEKTESVEDLSAEPETDEVSDESDTETPDETAEVEPDVETEESDEKVTAESESSEDDEPAAEEFYSEIVEKAKELVQQTDWPFVTTELANLAQNLSEGPESVTDKVKSLISEFEEIRDNFEEKKRAHYEELNRKKEENLARKKELLKSLSDIVNEENWTATKQVGKIKGQWETIKQLPQGEGETLDQRFKELMDEFEDHKVDRLVKKLQKEEENLELKLLLLDKMDA